MSPQSHKELFPNEPTFVHLLKLASQIDHVIVHDAESGTDATFRQIFADVVRTRQALRQSAGELFDPETNLLRESKVICQILSPGKYEFVVASLAVLSVGGAISALATTLLPEETFHLLKTSEASCILTDEQNSSLAQQSKEYAAAEEGLDIAVVPISTSSLSLHGGQDDADGNNNGNEKGCIDLDEFGIDESLTVDPHRPSLILYTSGTTGGRPKGVILDRQFFYEVHERATPDEIIVSHGNVTWGSGLFCLMEGIHGGARNEIIMPGPESATGLVVAPGPLWRRLGQGGVSRIDAPANAWSAMRRYFEQHIDVVGDGSGSEACAADRQAERDACVAGVRGLRIAQCTGSMPDPALVWFWAGLGKRLTVRYGASELGYVVMQTTDETDLNLERAIGRIVPGNTVKLSDGDHGEILVKKTARFTRYTGQKDASAYLTDDGFYKTGDLAHLDGDDYVFDGRAKNDFIFFDGLKVPLVHVEQQLLSLPCVEDGCILPIPDTEHGERVAALVRLRSSPPTASGGKEDSTVEGEEEEASWKLETPYLPSLRSRLRDALPLYMLPSALRILRDGEELPRTRSLKVLRREVLRLYFPASDSFTYPDDVEVFKVENPEGSERKAWDWSGLV